MILTAVAAGMAPISTPAHAAEDDVPPKDFSITATYINPGAGNGARWVTRIFADGTAVQMYHDPDNREKMGEFEVRKSFKVTRRDLISLFETVRKQDFLGLPNKLAPADADHGPFHTLSVTLGRKNHSVDTYWGKHDPNAEKRFFKVLAEVCRIIPEPKGYRFEDEEDSSGPANDPKARPTPTAPKKTLPG
jgi:hypothetical protein